MIAIYYPKLSEPHFSSHASDVLDCYITIQENPGVVTCMDSRTHGLQTGQGVYFREINGMTELNGTTHQIKGTHTYRHGYECVVTCSSYEVMFNTEIL